MPKFYGSIGYAETEETAPGVFESIITEREYFGDVLKDTRRLQNGENKLNDDIVINNRLSIVADPYAYEHFHNIKYVYWMGTKWKVSEVEVAYPRLILSVGGVYTYEQ